MAREDIARRGDERGRRINRRQWLAALGVGGAAALAGCSGGNTGTSTATGTDTETDDDPMGTQTDESSAADELPEVGGTYRRTVSSPVQTLNPLYNTEAGAGTLISYTLEYTYGFSPGTQVFPQLARSLTTDDSQVWVYALRDNLEFSDPYGQVTAEDLSYLINEVHMSEWAGTANADSWTGEMNVEATGDLELQIELPNVNALYPETYDPLVYPIPKDLLQPYVEEKNAEGLEQDAELNELQFTGNLGAYSLETWERSNRQVFTRNDDYYLKEHVDDDAIPALFENAPYFDRIESRVLQEQSSRLAALKTGETDTAGVPPNRVQEFRNTEGVTVYEQPQPYNVPLVYNYRDNGWNAGSGNLFRRKKFRQGLGCAVDKQRLVEGVYRGLANPQYTWQPQWSKWYPEDDSDIPKYGTGDLYGPEATRSRIEEAISDTEYSYNGERLVNPNGDQVTLELYHSAGQNTERATAEFVAQEFSANAGIEVNVNAIQGAQFATQYWQQEVPDNPDQYEWSNGSYNAGPREVTSANGWDMSLVYGLNTYPLNPTTASVFFIRDSFYNPYGYYPSWNADELFTQAEQATSTEELNEIFAEIFQKIADDQPTGMLVMNVDTPGYSSGIAGPETNFFSGWNFPGWYREE